MKKIILTKEEYISERKKLFEKEKQLIDEKIKILEEQCPEEVPAVLVNDAINNTERMKSAEEWMDFHKETIRYHLPLAREIIDEKRDVESAFISWHIEIDDNSEVKND
jgi:predicted dithiol-disulfide oxidoreductase (DUF899 family)